MQLAAEFVAYAVKYLAPISTASGGKINIVSFSQGGPNVSKKWILTFTNFATFNLNSPVSFFKLGPMGIE
jgi:hypothetical protein